MVKYVYAVLALAFVGFSGLVYLCAKDLNLAAYFQAFIAAFATILIWNERFG